MLQRKDNPALFPRLGTMQAFCKLFQNNLRGVIGLADDQVLGTNLGAKTTGGTFTVVNHCQVLFQMDGILRADLGADAASNAALGTATDSDSTFRLRCTGNKHMLIVFHGYNKVPGTDLGASHTAYTFLLIHLCHTVNNMDSIILTNSGTVTVAEAAVLTYQRTSAANLGSSQTVSEALILCLHTGTQLLTGGGVHTSVAGAPDKGHFPGNFLCLHTHDGGHGQCAVVTPGSTLPDFGRTI